MSHHASPGTASRASRVLMKQIGASPSDFVPVLLAAASQQIRCARGEHNQAEAQPGHMTYVKGYQVPAGTWYCRFCFTILRPPQSPSAAVVERKRS